MARKKFGYNSLRWIRQDWRFLKYTGLSDTGRKTFSHDKRCGAKGGVLPDGRVRLCLPLAVIQDLKRTKAGREALRLQIADKLKKQPGKRTSYNALVLEAFKRFQQSDPFEDKPKGKRAPVQLPLFDESSVKKSKPTRKSVKPGKRQKRAGLPKWFKEDGQSKPVTPQKYWAFATKHYGTDDIATIVDKLLKDNPVPLDIRKTFSRVLSGSGFILDKKIMYLYGEWAIVKVLSSPADTVYRIGNKNRIPVGDRKKMTYELQMLKTAEIYTNIFEAVKDGFKITDKTEFLATASTSALGSSRAADILQRLPLFRGFGTQLNRPYPQLVQISEPQGRAAFKYDRILRPAAKTLYTPSQQAFLQYSEQEGK